MKSFPLLLTLALLPASALAEQQCKFNQPQALELDLAGAKAVVFEVNSHDLRLQASPGAKAALAGRACASTRDLLEQLSLSQRKVGDKLVVTLDDPEAHNPEIVRLLVEAGGEIQFVGELRHSLEDVYMRLMETPA